MQKSNFKKKLITFKVFLVLFMFSSSARAQIEFGIKGGLNFNYSNNENQSISDLYEKSLITLQYGVSLDLGKIGFDFTINRGYGDKEIVFVEKVLVGNKDQIVRTNGMMTMVSANIDFSYLGLNNQEDQMNIWKNLV